MLCYCLPKDKAHLQPPLTIIFPGLGGKHYDKEREKYDDRVIVMFQRKAWVDRKTARRWVQRIRPHVARCVDQCPVRDPCNLFSETVVRCSAQRECTPLYRRALAEETLAH